jgi:hypothetical protein
MMLSAWLKIEKEMQSKGAITLSRYIAYKKMDLWPLVKKQE